MPAGFLEFLAAAVVMELTPGPNMTWLVLLSARAGWRAGLQAVAGITSGLALMGGVAASGAAALIAAYPLVYETLRWAGVIFLLYLAFEAWVGEKAGAARDEILADYPYLDDEDITAVLEFAARQNDHPVLRSA